MCEECAPSLPASRIIDHNSSGNSLGHVEDAASDNIQKIISLGGILMCNDAAVYFGRMELNCFVRD